MTYQERKFLQDIISEYVRVKPMTHFLNSSSSKSSPSCNCETMKTKKIFMPSCTVLTQPQQILVFSDWKHGFTYTVGLPYIFFLKLARSHVSRKQPKQWTIKKSIFPQLVAYGCVVMSSVAFIRSFHEGM